MKHLLPNSNQPRRRGISFIFVTISMVAIFGCVSLAVDLGRAELAQTQLQTAVDSAARYGALGLQNILYGQSAAAANAANAALQNKVDGVPLVLDQTNDVQLGIWDTAAHTFTVVTDPTLANAVRVTGRRVASRGTAIPLLFLQALGRSQFDITAQATAMLVPGATVNPTVPATSNPFLSGQPAGVSASNPNPHNNPDYAYGTAGKPNSSPVQALLPLSGGRPMTFDGVNGGATNDFNDPNRYTADGNVGWIVNNYNGAEHGISDLVAPINSLIAVFINDNAPGSNSAPSTLDFSNAASRDFTSLSPNLNQLFFIGDGRNSSGEVQQFVVPQGATRLFIGIMDGFEWNNNIGSFAMTIHAPGSVTLVD